MHGDNIFAQISMHIGCLFVFQINGISKKLWTIIQFLEVAQFYISEIYAFHKSLQ